MTRVATFSQSQVLTAELMRVNDRQFTVQQQISSGKVASQFKGIAKDASTLLSAKGVEAKIGQYNQAAKELTPRLEMQDLHLNELANAADNLRASVTEAVANGSGLALIEEVEAAFRSAVNVLNAKLDGKSLYAGTRTDIDPVNISTLADLVAAPSAADIFENNDLKATIYVDDNQAMEYGILADEVGGDLMSAIKAIADFNAGANGPFAAELTDAQKTFLEGQLGTLKSVFEGINTHIASNGLNQNELQSAQERHEATDIYLKSFISDIEDADLAEAITQLNLDQTAVEATSRVMAQLNRLSLLDFI